jgi:hypothetical protein
MHVVRFGLRTRRLFPRKKRALLLGFAYHDSPQWALVIPISNMSTNPLLFMSAFGFQLGIVEVDP